MTDDDFDGSLEGGGGAGDLFPVKLTDSAQASGTWYYTWTEQTFDASTGAYADAVSPRAGDKASGPFLAEVNDNQVSTPNYVWARLRGIVGGQPYYEFSAGLSTPAPAAVTVRDDASHVYSNITTIQVDTVNGLTLANPSPGEAEISVQAASVSGPGIVTTVAQTFVGAKRFNSSITVVGGAFVDTLSSGGINNSSGTIVSNGTASPGPPPDALGYPPSSAGLNVYKDAIGYARSGAEYLWAQFIVPASFATRKFVLWNEGSPGNPPIFSIATEGSGGGSGPVYHDGQTGTSGGGDTVVGGIITALGSSSGGLTVGTTTISGGTSGDILTVSGGSLGQVANSLTVTAGAGLSGGGAVGLGGNVTISLAAPVSVASGGTGQTSLASHGVLVGAGTSGVSATPAGTSGQPLLSGGPAADPSYGTLGAMYGGTGSDLSATGGAGQVVRQASAGAPLTVSALAASDLPTAGIGVPNLPGPGKLLIAGKYG